METAVQQAARTLGLPEMVLHNFMNLFHSIEAPHVTRTVGRPADRTLVDRAALLNSLVEEYDTKL